MKKIAKTFSSLQPYTLSLLRIMAGLLFLQHGTAKLFQFPHVSMFDGMELYSMMGAAGILELVGGILIILGLFTRVTAFVLSGQMAVAYFMFHHASDNFYPILNNGELAILYSFVFLYLATAGGGKLSLDRLRK